jgi:WD40 repeat protein
MSSPPPLLGALGVSWDLGAPVVALAWDVEGATVGFALGDGHLAVADAQWPGGPRVEAKAGGGVNLLPAEASAPRPVRALCHQGSCLAIAADAHGGFLSGGDDGRVVLVPRVGDPAVVAGPINAWIDAVACSRGGMRAHSSGRHVQRWQGERSEAIDLPAPATALAFSPDGACLAVAHSGGVTLWADDHSTRHLPFKGYHRALAWSPDGRYLVTGMQENALHGWRVADAGDIEMGGYPGQPLSLSFSHDGRYLATSGSTRPVCWSFDPPGRKDQPSECGLPSKTPLSGVACHPRQSLVAAGYANGAVLLCQPGSDAVLFIKGAGGGAINALAWSGNGSRLAFGAQDGLLGWLELPEALFRSPAERSRTKETVS